MHIAPSCIAAFELLQREGLPYIHCNGEAFSKG
jgi:hypothetical protein